MTNNISVSRAAALLAALCALPALLQAADDSKSAPAGHAEWSGERLSDGQPDVQGWWATDVYGHNNLTDPQGGAPGGGPGGNRGPRGARADRAPSRVSDPADGQVPFQPWARAKQEQLLTGFVDPTKPEYVDPMARCAPGGVSRLQTWHDWEIRQYPGMVVMLFNTATRVIYLDERPHLPGELKLWMSDSRGHWEGNTLVVDVTNSNSKHRLARTGEFASDQVHIVERFTFTDKDHYRYDARYTDPTVFTKPWTLTINAHRYSWADPTKWDNAKNGHPTNSGPANYDGKDTLWESYEYTCIEGNGGHGEEAAH